jgi:hypothetical protein
MKTKIVFLAVFLTFAIARSFGQSVPEEYAPGTSSISTAGPPTFETTISGLEIKVWVMTQEEHRQLMEGMNNDKDGMKEDKDMGINKKGKNTGMNASHHIKVVVTDAQSGEVKNGLNAKVEVTSPSKKNTWIDLRNMADHYGNDLDLKEKGSYMFTINMDDKGVPKTTHFNYTVR